MGLIGKRWGRFLSGICLIRYFNGCGGCLDQPIINKRKGKGTEKGVGRTRRSGDGGAQAFTSLSSSPSQD